MSQADDIRAAEVEAWRKERFADLIIVCSNGELKAHRFVLGTRSAWFMAKIGELDAHPMRTYKDHINLEFYVSLKVQSSNLTPVQARSNSIMIPEHPKEVIKEVVAHFYGDEYGHTLTTITPALLITHAKIYHLASSLSLNNLKISASSRFESQLRYIIRDEQQFKLQEDTVLLAGVVGAVYEGSREGRLELCAVLLQRGLVDWKAILGDRVRAGALMDSCREFALDLIQNFARSL